MSAVKPGQLRVLCAVVGANQQPASLSASQTLSDQAVQSAQLTGNQGSLIEFLLLTALFFSPSLSRGAGFCQVHFFPPASCQNTDCTELHTQALIAPPTISVPNTHLSSNMQYTISGCGCYIWLFLCSMEAHRIPVDSKSASFGMLLFWQRGMQQCRLGGER